MVLVDVDVAQDADDFQIIHTSATQYDGEYDRSNATWSYTRFGTNTGSFSGSRVFFLFKGITIPMGSIIDDATLTLKDMEKSSTNNISLSVRAVNNSAPVSLSTNYNGGAGTIFNTAVLTPAVSFTVTTGTATDFPLNVKPHVQALVDAFDYNNDAMMFRMAKIPVTSNNTISYQMQGFEYQVSPPDSSANLTINYTPASQEQFTVDAILQAVVAGGMKAFIINSILKGCRALPDADISNVGNWSDFRLGNQDTELWDELNEEPPDNDGTAVVSIGNPTTGDTFEVNLEDCPDPLKSDGHIVRFTAKGSSSNVKVRAELRQGVTLIATTPQFSMSQSYQTFSYNLSEIEADSITDYTDLRVRIIPETV